MKTFNCLMIMANLCIFPTLASADWERTVSNWDTRLPDQGKLQVSLWGGYSAWNNENIDGNDIFGDLDLTYGLEDNWSVAISPSFYRWEEDGGISEAGISDTSLMSTYRFLDEAKDNLDLAVMGSLKVPTGDEDKGLGSGSVEPKIKLLAAKTLGPIIAVANLGGYAILDARDGEKDFVMLAALEGVYPLSEQLSINAALTTLSARWDGEDELVDLGFGARFNLQQMFVGGMAYTCLTDNYDWGLQLAAGFEF